MVSRHRRSRFPHIDAAKELANLGITGPLTRIAYSPHTTQHTRDQAFDALRETFETLIERHRALRRPLRATSGTALTRTFKLHHPFRPFFVIPSIRFSHSVSQTDRPSPEHARSEMTSTRPCEGDCRHHW
jgi:hypothetical protein